MDRSAQDGVFGHQQAASGNTEFNALVFLIDQMLGRMNTATLVKVVAVTVTGRTAAVGTVDVTSLVNQTDGYGNSIPHTVIYSIPFFRLQGGMNAVICNPKIGDIGFCVFADSDLTDVKTTGAAAMPASLRRFDMADGLFIGGWNLNTPPVRYVVVDDTGISIEAGSAPADIHATRFTINCPVTINGDITHNGALHSTGNATFDKKVTATQDVVAGPMQASLVTHKHPGVMPGVSVTGSPI